MRQSCKRDSVKILDTCQLSVHGICLCTLFFVRRLGALAIADTPTEGR